jgi:hypothetical protein
MRLEWKISLSNGKNFKESDFDGENAPWLALKEYLEKENLKITSLCLVDGNRTFNLPSSGNNPKFRAFINVSKPIKYNFFRMLGSDITGEDRQLFSVIEAIYSNYKLQLWVNEYNPNSCHVLVI